MSGRARTPSFFSTDTSQFLERIPENEAYTLSTPIKKNQQQQQTDNSLPSPPPHSPSLEQSKSARKRKVLGRRQSTLARQLSQPSTPVPELGQSKYAREHVNSAARPFKLLEEGFLMDDIIKWVERYAKQPTKKRSTKKKKCSKDF